MGRSVFSVFVFLLFAWPSTGQGFSINPASLRSEFWRAVSTSGGFALSPAMGWVSGDFDALSDSFFGYKTPRVNQLSVAMDPAAVTTYEGGLFFRKLKLKVGLDVDVDKNLVGEVNRFMGYMNYDIFELRVEKSTLKGTANWEGAPQGGMPQSVSFDNPFVNVDLLYYLGGDVGVSYLGIGYSSYRLPVQLDCLTFDASRDSVWWAPVVSFYQPDMAFHIYSVLLGIDSLHDALMEKGLFGRLQGFSPWLWTQDRAGAGISEISSEAESWIRSANGLPLWSSTQIAMLVDYNLTLGLQWVGHLGRLRMGFGLGYNVGGQTVTCVTPKGPVDAQHVDASPSLYLAHGGVVLKASISF